MGSGWNTCDDKWPGVHVVNGKRQLRHGEERRSKAHECYLPSRINSLPEMAVIVAWSPEVPDGTILDPPLIILENHQF
jgi:hypothetical protein